MFNINFQHALVAQGAIDGYMKGTGNTDVAVSFSQEGYDTYFFGEDAQEVDIAIKSVGFFLEHGITDSLDLVVTTSYLELNDQRGLQDAIVAVKYQNLHQVTASGTTTVITSAGIGFPLGGYSTEVATPIGERAVSFQTRILAQYQTPTGLFGHLQTGFDFRIEPVNQFAVPVLVRGGFAGKYFYADAWLERYHTLNAGRNMQIAGGQGSRWWKVGGTVYVPIVPGIGVVANAARILSGENIGESFRFGGGLVVRL